MKLFLTLLVSFLLMRLPIIGSYLMVADTMIHESGHALMALLTQGHVYSISLYANTEGLTLTSTSSWIARVLVSLSGYVFSSVAAYVFFLLLRKGKHHVILYTLIGFSAVNLLLWVRNLYGIIWLVTFLAILIYLLRSKKEALVEYAILFISGIVLVDSVWSAFQILDLGLFYSSLAGDAANLAHATFIPAFVWGALFFAQSLLFAYLSCRNWLKKPQAHKGGISA